MLGTILVCYLYNLTKKQVLRIASVDLSTKAYYKKRSKNTPLECLIASLIQCGFLTWNCVPASLKRHKFPSVTLLCEVSGRTSVYPEAIVGATECRALVFDERATPTDDDSHAAIEGLAEFSSRATRLYISKKNESHTL